METLETSKNHTAVKSQVCPECKAKLEPFANRCHFCGHELTTAINGKGRIIDIHPEEKPKGLIYQSNELTIEEVKALYFSEDALLETPYILYRIDSASTRYYYTLDEFRKPELFTSVTSFIHQQVPPGIGLINYYKMYTPEQQARILGESAAYGTLMDICCNQFLINGKFSLDDTHQIIKDFMHDNGYYSYDADVWESFLKKDMLAFAQFIIDYDVKPLAIGIPLVSKKYKLGGMQDLLCTMNDALPTKAQIEAVGKAQRAYDKAKKAKEPVAKLRKALKEAEAKVKPHRVTAIVDYKSKIGQFKENGSRGDFYEAHELQLHVYRDLMKENFPKVKVDMLFNWSPKSWRTKPGYNLKDQTHAESAKKLKYYYGLHLLENPEHTQTLFTGDIELGQPVDKNYGTVSLIEFIQNRHTEIMEEKK